MAPWMAACSALLERAASLPPLSNSPLPERMASEAICGSASGRDSKITSSTPSGDVTRVSSRPEEISVRETTRPRGSSCTRAGKTREKRTNMQSNPARGATSAAQCLRGDGADAGSELRQLRRGQPQPREQRRRRLARLRLPHVRLVGCERSGAVSSARGLRAPRGQRR